MEVIVKQETLPAVEVLGADVLRNLERHAYYARGAMSPNTERARRTASNAFTAWCVDRDLQPLPATVDTLVAFVDDAATRQKPATVVAYVSHISAMHDAARVPNPCKAPEVILAKKRMFREKGRRQRQALGITSELRQKMLDSAPDSMIGLRNRAALALAYDTGLRRSELVAVLVEDLSFDEDQTGAVLLRKSKTDQEGEGQLRYMAADTVRLVLAWIAAAKLTEGPLLRRVTRWGTPGTEALHDGVVRQIFKDMAGAADLPEGVVDGISAHSTRVGMAQDQASSGCTLVEIMQSGGWKTAAMVGRYTERLNVKRSGSAKLAQMQGRV